MTPFPPGAQYPGVALSADRTQGYGGDVAVEAPTRPRRPRRSDTLRAEARLAYAILGPTLLVITCLVAYPVPVSYGGSPTPAAGEVLNTHVIPKMVQRVLVENWEPAKALDECHKKIAEIYARHEKA